MSECVSVRLRIADAHRVMNRMRILNSSKTYVKSSLLNKKSSYTHTIPTEY